MSTHVNTIVALTRAMHDQSGPAWQALHERRHGAVLAAIRAGIDPDLIAWAIDLNEAPADVQALYALAHTAAALELAKEGAR